MLATVIGLKANFIKTVKVPRTEICVRTLLYLPSSHNHIVIRNEMFPVSLTPKIPQRLKRGNLIQSNLT
jgi:hypothetical protein